MIKFLMSLITLFISFFGLLGTANSGATPVVNQELKPLASSFLEQPVSLNVSASLWQLTNQDSQNTFPHLGCSCATCSQV